MSVTLLSARGLSERAGLTLGTVRNYRRWGYLPEPDFVVDNKPLWRVETVERWLAERAARKA